MRDEECNAGGGGVSLRRIVGSWRGMEPSMGRGVRPPLNCKKKLPLENGLPGFAETIANAVEHIALLVTFFRQ